MYRKMDCMVYIIAYSTVLFATKSLAAINCPDVLIKKGSLHVFSCDSDVNINDFYWYRGETSELSPILTLDNGRKGGSEYNTEHFDIDNNGSMIISDVKLEHESYYTLIGYYDGVNFESATFMVNVTIPPDPPCPVIEGCIPCTRCVIRQPNESGTLKCSVSEARPLIPLAWNITSQAGVSFIKYQPVEQRNEATDSWETFVLVKYTLTTPCGVHANIYCTAQDKAKIISSPVAALEISNDPCADVISTLAPADVDASSRHRLMLILFAIAIISLLVSVAIYLMCRLRARSRTPGFSTLGKQDDPEGVPLLLMPPTKGKRAPRIVSLLERTYEKYCYVEPLPWGEKIQINALYTNCQCTVTTRDGNTCTISSEKLLTGEYIEKEKRVLFIGDLGFGKTTFTKQVVNNWIHNKDGKFLLIYILLKDVKSDMRLTEIVLNHLPVESDVTVNEVKNIISQYGCLVLLDGLDELSMTAEERIGSGKDENYTETLQSAKGEESVSSLTLQQMLNGDIKLKDININIWVTSREIDYANSGFPTPYVKVKMTGFSEEQAEDYIKKTCRYYCPPEAKAVGGKPDDELRITTSNPISSTSTEVDLSMKNGQTAQGDQQKIGQINVGKVTDTKENALYASTIIVDERMKGEDGSKGELTNTEVMNKHRKLEEWEKVSRNVKQFLEHNDVLSSFEKTPLLFIMMVHIISAKHTSAFEELKEITINKLTTLISTVFICLESRYVQKRNMSSSEEITHLESKLGETALRHNVQITVEEPEFWVSAIGEKNVKMALEIGLLRQSTNAAASSKGFRHLAFSSFTGIEFYNELFQAYIAANFVKENKGHIKQLIKSVKNTKEHETFRVLQFLCGLDGSVMETVCNALRGFNKYNNLIDCLYEGNDQETFKKVVQGLAGDTLNISYLDRSYHRNSLSTFCMKCNELGVKLTSMAFHSDCVISYLTTLRLPELKYLELYEAVLSEEDFLSFLKWLPHQKVNNCARLIQCTPHTPQWTSEHLEEVKRQKQTKIEIHRKKNKNDLTVSVFKYGSGGWTWRPHKTGK